MIPAIAQAQPGETEDDLRRRIEQLEAQVETLTSTVQALTGARTADLPAPPPQPPVQGPAPLAATSATTPREPLPAVTQLPICRMENVGDFNDAFLDPRGLRRCAALSSAPGTDYDKGRALAAVADNPLPDRPYPAAGVSTALEFGGDSSKATVTLAHPVVFRNRSKLKRAPDGKDFLWFRPQLLTVSGSVGVPVVKGDRIFFSDEERPDRADFDILSGTTIKLGVDFLSFRKFKREASFARTALVLKEAREQCRKDAVIDAKTPPTDAEYGAALGLTETAGKVDYQEPRDPKAPGFRTTCTDADLIRYIMELDSSGESYVRAALAAKYQASFWEEDKEAIPTLGAGFSVEYGTTDFKYQQADISLVPATDPTRLKLQVNQGTALATEKTDTEDDWKIQGYFALFWRTLSADYKGKFATGPYTQGIMFIGSASYVSSHQFRPGTSEVTVCPAAATGSVFVRCSAINIDRPYLQDGFHLSGEARMQVNNVPVLGILGAAPKYTLRLRDDRNLIDIPIYLSGKDGWGAAGIRYRHSWGGVDLLGNPEITKSDLSVFLSTPISFRKF